jgi:hypothetical protein
MNKTLAMAIKDTKIKLANICNESGLSPVILDLVIQGIYSEIHYLAEKQTLEEEANYRDSLTNNDIKDKKILNKGDGYDSKKKDGNE